MVTRLFKFFVIGFIFIAAGPLMGMETTDKSEREPKSPKLMEMENKININEWHQALRAPNLKKVEKLLQLGADPNAPYFYGEVTLTPWDATLIADYCFYRVFDSSTSEPLIKLLLQYKANPNILANFVVCSENYISDPEVRPHYLSIIKLLLTYGANPYYKTCLVGDEEVSAFSIAQKCSDEELVTLFKNVPRTLKSNLFFSLTNGSLQLPREIAKIIVQLRHDYTGKEKQS